MIIYYHYHQQVALNKLYPPALDGTALNAIAWPAFGICSVDSILEQAPKFKCTLCPPLSFTTIMFESILSTVPDPVTAP